MGLLSSRHDDAKKNEVVGSEFGGFWANVAALTLSSDIPQKFTKEIKII